MEAFKDPKPTDPPAAPFGDYGWVVIVLAVAVVLLVSALCFTCGRLHALKRQLTDAQEFKPLCDEPPPVYVGPASTSINS